MLTKTDVVDDEQLGMCPGPEPTLVGPIGQSSVEIIEHINAASVADTDACSQARRPKARLALGLGFGLTARGCSFTAV